MVKKITEKFERAMKKGFISTLILLVLEKEIMHGRQIKKAIEERTFGGWMPSDSTIYTILKDLKENDLVKQINLPYDDEKTVNYEITEKGKNALEIMVKKEQEIRESMRSIITSTFGIRDELTDEEIRDFLNRRPPFLRMNETFEDNTLENLNFQKVFVEKRIEVLTKKLQNIKDKILKLEKKDQK
jgi:DNA-binding PadR family transcriptional regulator